MSSFKPAEAEVPGSDFRRIAGYILESGARLSVGAIVGVFVARHLGPDGFGLLSFATGIFAIAVVVGSLGMRPILIRDLSSPGPWEPTVASALARQVPAAAMASLVGGAVVVSSRGWSGEALLTALVLLPFPVLALHDTARAVLEARLRVRQIVRATLVAAILAASLRVAGIIANARVPIFALAITAEAGLITAFLAGRRLRLRHAWRILKQYAPASSRALVSNSWPLLLSALAVTIYMRIDLVMLGLIQGDAETGWYSVAARVSELWYFVPVGAAAAMRPRLARLFSSGKQAAYRKVTQRLITGCFWFSIPVTVTIFAFADTIVNTLFGAGFEPAAGMLRIHVWAMPFVFLSLAANQWFIDRNQTRTVMSRSLIGAAINLLGNLILIPRLGGLGAAIATVLAYAIAGVLINGVMPQTRPVFYMQGRALIGDWGRR